METPIASADCQQLFEQLFRTQKSNHICLASVRLPKRLRLAAFANLVSAETAGFRFHDHISIVANEEFKNIPSNLTQIGETCVLLTKSDDMNRAATAWFRPELGNASNVWDVTPQANEFFVKDKTTTRFSNLETLILLAQLASPLIARRLLVLGAPEPAMMEFAHKFDLKVHVVTSDEVAARRVIKNYHKFLDTLKGTV